MNEAQTIFTIFFAISWGTVSNVLPRWKPFNFPLFCRLPQATKRACLAFVLFNLVPAFLFVVVMIWLRGPSIAADGAGWTWSHGFSSLIWRAVLPGLLPLFGVYRLWMAIVESRPNTFYLRQGSDAPADLRWATDEPWDRPTEPNQLSLNLKTQAACGNYLFAFLHILIVLLPALVPA